MARMLVSMAALFLMVVSVGATTDCNITATRPDPNNNATYARWLVASNSWGFLSTISVRLNGAPYATLHSYSDGLPCAGSGYPYFYLTGLDETVQDAEINANVSFALTETTLGTCKDDAEFPTCGKLTINGPLAVIPKDDSEADYAKQAVFSKHPEFAEFPPNHNFQFYKLNVVSIRLLDVFGGPKDIDPVQYFAAST